MKLRFTQGHRPKGAADNIPEYKVGETYEFKGAVAQTYARKYVNRGYAVEVKDEPVVAPVEVEAERVERVEPTAPAPVRFNSPRNSRR